jgi:hypothetical protein
MVERGVREHDAEVWVARGDQGREGVWSVECGAWAVCEAVEEDYRRFGGTKEAFFKWGDFADATDCIEGWENEGEGLFFAMLSFAQEAHGIIIMRSHHEVKAAETFHGENLTGAQSIGCGGENGLSRETWC